MKIVASAITRFYFLKKYEVSWVIALVYEKEDILQKYVT